MARKKIPLEKPLDGLVDQHRIDRPWDVASDELDEEENPLAVLSDGRITFEPHMLVDDDVRRDPFRRTIGSREEHSLDYLHSVGIPVEPHILEPSVMRSVEDVLTKCPGTLGYADVEERRKAIEAVGRSHPYMSRLAQRIIDYYVPSVDNLDPEFLREEISSKVLPEGLAMETVKHHRNLTRLLGGDMVGSVLDAIAIDYPDMKHLEQGGYNFKSVPRDLI